MLVLASVILLTYRYKNRAPNLRPSVAGKLETLKEPIIDYNHIIHALRHITRDKFVVCSLLLPTRTE